MRSTNGEVIITTLYCKHLSYSPGERSKLSGTLLVSNSLFAGVGLEPALSEVTRTNQCATGNVGCKGKILVMIINTVPIGWFSINTSCARLRDDAPNQSNLMSCYETPIDQFFQIYTKQNRKKIQNERRPCFQTIALITYELRLVDSTPTTYITLTTLNGI